MQDELIFVGYTNGDQILYASSKRHGGEGSFYRSAECDRYIPLYMLKTHASRIESTTNGYVTLEQITKARGDSEVP